MTMTEDTTTTTTTTTLTFTSRFAAQLANVALFASKDKARPIINSVLFEIGADEQRIVAADTYALCVENLAGTVTVEGPVGSWVVPIEVVDDIVKALRRGADTLNMMFTNPAARLQDGTVAWQVGSLSGTSLTVGGDYPNYRQLMPTAEPVPTARIGLGAKMLARIGKVVDAGDPKAKAPTLAFSFYGELKPSVATIGTATILQMPVRLPK